LAGSLEVDMCVCSECGKIEFYTAKKKEFVPDEVPPNKYCPECGKEYSGFFQKCPDCTAANFRY